jgi:hypothetical protein
MKAICQKWEESERGWGSRPDGYSLHLCESDRQAFIKKYWDRMPASAPDEYSRPDGAPYECEVDEATAKKLVTATAQDGFGIRCSGRSPVGLDGKQGSDGWRKAEL